MICANCGLAAPEGVKFCRHCGSPLPAIEAADATLVVEPVGPVCANCGLAAPEGVKFCRHCGSPLPAIEGADATLVVGSVAVAPGYPVTPRIDTSRGDGSGSSSDQRRQATSQATIPRRRDSKWALWVVAALFVLGGGAGAAYAFGAIGKSSSGAPAKRLATAPTHSPARRKSEPTSTTAPDLARTEAQSINSLLVQSSSDRNEIVAATSDIGNCGNLSQDQATLTSAAESRQTLLNQLSELNTSQLANSTQLVSALTAAWEASMQSDTSYAAWASDLEQGGCVGQASTNDANWQAAANADTQATTAKDQFITIWNPIAATYGLPEYNANQI
jgi:RNA polymerase subunit RPABC4/transcription elongation factor Spt4